MFNLTEIAVLLISIIVSICVSLVSKQLVPWLKDRKLYDAAIVAVNAAEALFGRYHGEDKLAYALDALKQKGYNIESSVVIDALKAAWLKLNEAMIVNGFKKTEENKDE